MTEMLEQAVVWDAHAGLFPSPEMDLNIRLRTGANTMSII